MNQRHVRDVELRKRSCAQANTHARLDGIDKMDQIIRSHAALTPMLSCMAAASFFACCSLPLARIGRFGNGASGVLIGVTRNQHPEKHKPKYARPQFGTTARFFSLVLWSSTPYNRETFSICAFACSQCWRWQRQFPIDSAETLILLWRKLQRRARIEMDSMISSLLLWSLLPLPAAPFQAMDLLERNRVKRRKNPTMLGVPAKDGAGGSGDRCN